MAEIPGINEQARQRPVYVNQAAEMAKGLGITEKAQVVIKEVAGLLGSERSVRVSNAPAMQTAEVGTPTGATGVPTLDNPDDAKAKEVDLEKLIAYLQLENDEQQAEMARDRIEVQKNNLETQHKDQMEKLQKSLDEMDKAAKANKVSRIFGWLMTALAVIAAVVTCVATAGAAVAVAAPIMGLAIAGAALSVTNQVLNETGATEKIAEGIGKLLQGVARLFGAEMSDETAKAAGSIIFSVAMTAATLACTLGSAGMLNAAAAAGKVALTLTVSNVQTFAQLLSTAGGLGSIAAGSAATALNYKSGMASADLSETEKFLAQMRRQLEESQEELQAILEQIQAGFQQVVAILSSETDTQKAIAQQLGAMA